jgi:hypothetical protein
MNKKQTIFIVCCVALLLLVVVVSIRNVPPKQQAQPVGLLQGDPPPQGGCSQCLGNNCYSAPCNMDCVPVGNGCETRIAGGAEQPYTRDTKANNGDYAEFYLQIVLKNNEAMEKAGVQYGDLVTRVNGVYAGSDEQFAKLVLSLPAGTKLQIFRWVVVDGMALPKTMEFVL